MLTEIKSHLSNLITRKAVIAVENGALSARCPEKMAANGGGIAY